MDAPVTLRPPVQPQSWGPKIPEADAALLEKLVAGVCRYRMAVPAIFMLESFLPLALVGSQAMLFLAPMMGGLMAPGEYERLARLLERRDVIERFMVRLERALDEEAPPRPRRR